MTECNAIIEANNEIDTLKRENKKLNESCVRYGFEVGRLEEENEQLKKVLGAILLEVKQDISNTNQTGEIKVFINPNSFDLISEVLRKYGALKDWY